MCVFLHAPHFTLVNVLLCLAKAGWGGQLWGSLTQLEVPGFAAKTGSPPLAGEPQGSLEPCSALGKGVQGTALIPLHPTAGLGGGNPPSSSAGKASLTRANENNQK